ncbi:hypothetical protein HNR38_000111 [Marinobacter oulmenensis]|uniref:DUF3391 domain-containing protein n=1 Tax=Marinobacter oulmenensis TaxID=643747 RepID=A0A840U604_9GAMM|nr:DUF3391 domain-containing protein [Marinobacter oulmenensis]MBB5319643.1 hypothetical protein [Marinobacter oulmenensis]
MIKRIPVSALRVGMYITDLNNDWIPHNSQRKRGIVRREETIEKIRRIGVKHVYIDVAPIHQLADELQNSVLRNANALSCLGRIREKTTTCWNTRST